VTFRRAFGAVSTLALVALSIVCAQPAAAADSCVIDTTTHVLTANVSDTSGISVTSTTLSVGSCGSMDATQIDVANVTATNANGTSGVSVTLPWPNGPSGPLDVNLDLGGGTDTLTWDSRTSETPLSIHAASGGFDFDDDGGTDLSLANTETFVMKTGIGDDTFDASAGIPPGMTDVQIEDGPGHDTITGGPENDWLNPWDGDDAFTGGLGDDTVDVMSLADNTSFDLGSWDGGGGEDTLQFDDQVIAALSLGMARQSGGTPWKMTFSGFEDLKALNANSTLIGDDGHNILEAVHGGILRGADGDDTIIGQQGGTVADFGDADGVSVDLATGTATGDGTDTLVGIENVSGSPGNDTIIGDDDDSSVMQGEGGDDTISGGPFEDLLIGGSGSDDLRGSGGLDDLHGGPGKDLLIGGDDGDDFSGGSGHDDIRGGPGADSWNASFFSIAEQDEHPSEGASVDLATGVVANDGFGTSDAISGMEDVTGTFFADTLIGDSGNNAINGSSGNDRLVGGPGDDELHGATGRDTVSFASASRALDVDLTHGVATGVGLDTLDGIEVVIGGPDGDTLRGSAADERLEGHAGDDLLFGRAGGDALIGGPGADAMDGGLGYDTCNGGNGYDDTATECETIWRVP
jgi:Ca2+-binding RTX toxin-like protein